MQRLLVILLLMFCALPVFAADSGNEAGEAESGISGRYLLMDANGRGVSNEDFPGRFQLIAFGYTFCPDICPTTLSEMAAIMNKLGAAGEGLQPLFVTVDPERDTAAVLRTYTEFFHPRILGLTGSAALVRRAANNFKVRYEKVSEPDTPPERYAVDHSAGMFLLDPNGRYLRKFAFGTSIADIAEGIRDIMAERNPASSGQNRR